MKKTSNFDENFEDFAYDRYNSNTSEEIENLESAFTTIYLTIKQKVDDELKKLLERLFATHNDLLANAITKAYGLGLADYMHITKLFK